MSMATRSASVAIVESVSVRWLDAGLGTVSSVVGLTESLETAATRVPFGGFCLPSEPANAGRNSK